MADTKTNDERRTTNDASKPTIAFVLSSAATAQGGSESYVLSVAQALARHVNVKLVAGAGQLTDDFKKLAGSGAVACRTVPFVSRSSFFAGVLARTPLQRKLHAFDIEALSMLAQRRSIVRFLSGASVVETHYPLESLLFSALPSLCTTVMHFHGSWPSPLYGRLKHRLLKNTDELIACCHWCARELRPHLAGRPVTAFYNPVDLSRFSLACEERFIPPFPVGQSVFKIGLVGRLGREKGVHVLCAAARELGNDVQVFLAGPCEPGFERELRLYTALPNVTALGPIPNHELAGFYRSLDCFVLPSLLETFPITLLEAMACGVPVIASRTGGIPELVQEGHNGLLVAPGSVGELVEALRTLKADRGRCREIGRLGMQRVCKEFSLQAHIGKLVAFYERLIAR